MASNKAKATASRFIREFGFHTVSLSALEEIMGRQGYTIIEYNNIHNDEAVAALLRELELEKHAARTKGFTYADSKYRLVFIHEDLSEAERLFVLAHEEGHIYCDHFSSVPILGRDVIEEHEANEFSHYILRRHSLLRARSCLRSHWKAVAISLAAVALVAAGLVLYAGQLKERSYYGEFYITSAGNKYHERGCIFTKDKSTVRRMTLSEFESGAYEPCGICLP